jgi:hypothetical protein
LRSRLPREVALRARCERLRREPRGRRRNDIGCVPGCRAQRGCARGGFPLRTRLGMIGSAMRSNRARAVVPLLVLTLAAAAHGQKPNVTEPRIGAQFAVPKGWLELPGDHDRHATLRLFAAPRALASRGATSHTPVLRVMFFGKGGDDTKDVVDGLPRATPFRGLVDFARRGLGATDVKEQPQKAGDVQATRVTADGIGGERTLLGQCWALDDGEAALCVEVVTNQVDKLGKDVDAILGSIAAAPRVAAARVVPPWLADPEWTKKDAAARVAARRAWAQDVVAATAKAPQLGFKVSASKHWTVLSSADAAFTKKAVNAAEVAREFFGKRLPELAVEPPLPAVLRVFDSIDQYRALLAVRGDEREFDAPSRECYVVNDRDNGGPNGFGPLLRAVLWNVLDDYDPAVLPGLPRWLDLGFWELLRSSTFDGKKYEFAPSDVERGRLEYYRQKREEMPALWGVMQEKSQPSPEDGKPEPAWAYTPESARLLRWLWFHDGQKAFGKPALVADYVKAIAITRDAFGPSPVVDVPVVGLTEAQQLERNKRFYKYRDAVLADVNARAVPFEVAQWEALNEKWLAFNKGFK